MKFYLVPENVMKLTINYLETKPLPHNEVDPLIDSLRASQEVTATEKPIPGNSATVTNEKIPAAEANQNESAEVVKQEPTNTKEN